MVTNFQSCYHFTSFVSKHNAHFRYLLRYLHWNINEIFQFLPSFKPHLFTRLKLTENCSLNMKSFSFNTGNLIMGPSLLHTYQA